MPQLALGHAPPSGLVGGGGCGLPQRLLASRLL